MKNLAVKSIVQISYIFKACFKLSYFPTGWKIAKVIPTPKPGKPFSNLANNRPINLLNILGKLMERIICQHFITHLDKNNITAPHQFGFRCNHTTIHQLQRVTEHIIIERNKNRTTQLLLLDIQKAFDSVQHTALITKLHDINTPASILNTIANYLSDRKFFVSLNDTRSSTKTITAGAVPQGFILGPLFFTIYINDLSTSQNTRTAIYADDAGIYALESEPSYNIPTKSY